MNKEALAQQIKDMETKLAEMKAELEKPEPIVNYWQPKYGQEHWYVNVYGNLQKNYTADPGLLKKGHHRVFETEEEANKYADYVRAEESLKKEIAILNEGWAPDWRNRDQTKYSFSLIASSLITSKKRISIERNCDCKFHDSFMYLKSLKLADTLINTHKKELITYLSY